MWRKQTVEVILPTYREEKTIRKFIQGCFRVEHVDSVLVVNNNATPKTVKEVAKTKAKMVYEPKQGYGFAIRRGLKETKADLIIITEPDGTFVANDIIKLLAYSDDFDLVLGSRTYQEMIWEGANMGFFLKWGNWAMAKIIEILFNGPNLTDVGCTTRLIKKSALKKIGNKFTVGGSHFGPEMILLALTNNIKTVMIPVNYKNRVRKSMGTKNYWNAAKIAINMFILIIKYRFWR